MKWIKLHGNTGGRTCISNHRFEELNKYKWYAHPDGYVLRYTYKDHKKESVQMHRQIMGCVPFDGKKVDHVDCNGFNNVDDNLRWATHAQNCKNRAKPKNNSSGYKGVSWNKKRSLWVARICIDYREIHLGFFSSKVKAARVYDEAAVKYHGEFARTNFKRSQDE